MQTKTNQAMPKYIYMPLPDGAADVFIYKFIEEDEDGLIYESNEFRTDRLTESDVAADPFKFLDYEEKEKTPEERIAELEKKVDALTFSLNKISESVVEVIKKEDSEMPTGDYLNPIRYITGMTVETGKFYTDGDDIWEAWNTGVPNDFSDERYFDIIK